MLACAEDGRLFIVDRDAHEVLICTTDGRRLSGLGTRHGPLQPSNHPTDVAFSPSGDIYVSDGYADRKVHRFRSDGSGIAVWGTLGCGRGEFMNPHAVWVRADGVIVVDRGNNRLQLFTEEGAWLEEWLQPAAGYMGRRRRQSIR